jgi:hypothetical protein
MNLFNNVFAICVPEDSIDGNQGYFIEIITITST